MSKLRELMYVKTRSGITKSYKEYLLDPVAGEAKLYGCILRFAQSKIARSLFGLSESYETMEDYAQEVAINIWGSLHTFQGEPDVFYSWLHRICYIKGIDARRNWEDEKKDQVALFVDSDDYPEGLEDNPILYEKASNDSPVKEIPEWVVGLDRTICEFFIEGLTYEEVAEMTGKSLHAIRKRVVRMKKQAKEIYATS